MRATRILGVLFASLIFGIAAPAFAQRAQQGESSKQHGKHAQSAPKQKSQRAQEKQRVRHDAWQEHRAASWESEHRTWQQRGGYHGHQVPDTRFRRYFGPEHGFRVNALPFRLVSGQPGFLYRGYWLTVVDPWPEYWENNWYSDDVVYVTNVDNGYYLVNRSHPDVRVALRISL